MTTSAPPPPPAPLMSALAPQQADPVRPGHTVHATGHKLARNIRLGAIALAVMGVAAFGIIIVSAYDSAPTPEDVPLVTAGEAPARERPVEEGGMQVANRDSTVFNRLSSGPVDAPTEQLMPAPEQPVDMPAVAVPSEAGTMPPPRRPDGSPALTADEIRMMHAQRRQQMTQPGDAASQAMNQLESAANNVPAGVTDGMTSTVVPERLEPPAAAGQRSVSAPAPVIAPAPAAIIGSATASAPQLSDEGSAVTEDQAEAPAVAAAPAPVQAPAAVAPRQVAPRAVAPTAGATRVVQLGAVRSEEAAKAEWIRLQTRYRAQLGKLEASIQRADLGARGIYWRVRGGPVSADDGKKICDALKSAGQNCMVVGR